MMTGPEDSGAARVRRRRRHSRRRWWKRLTEGERQLQLVLIVVMLALSVVIGLGVASQCLGAAPGVRVGGRHRPGTVRQRGRPRKSQLLS